MSIHPAIHKNIFIVIALSLSIGAVAWGDEPCSSAVPLALDATWRGPADAAGATHCLEVEVPASGFLALDLSTPGATSRAVLVPLDARSGVHVRRTATGTVIAAPRPGAVRFRVTAEDHRAELPPYKARVAFVAGLHAKDEDNGEIEVDPDPLAYCGAASLKDEDNGEIEVDPDPAVHCAHDLAAASALLTAKLAAVCGLGEVDDHGDVALCATPVGVNKAYTGELGNGRGDDEDVFRFRLTEPRTVEITSTGAVDTFGHLFDRFGHRLASGGDGAGFRIVRALGPGTYFVRVEGRQGAAGSYSIAIATVR